MSSDDTIKLLRRKIDEIIAEDASFGQDPNEGPASTMPVTNYEPQKRNSSSKEFEDSPQKAFNKIVAILNAADKSEHALRERLKKAGFSENSIEEAINRAVSYGFINDLRYADVLIRSRIAQGKGSAGIERELKEHCIDPSSIPGWPYEYGVEQDTELERALDFLRRKPPHSKNLRDGAYRKLMQKGFPSSVASSAARIWVESEYR